jgi:ABC-type microcin C transport system permease subunit YejE
MRFFLSAAIIICLSYFSKSQMSYQISNAKPAVVSKKANPAYFEVVKKMKWANVISDCIAPNEITDPVIYFGQIVEQKGSSVLQ